MIKKIALVALASIVVAGCTTTDPYTGEKQISKTTGGAVIGALAGAAGGLVVANQTGADPRAAALIGAGIGGLTGGAIGNYMDQQEAELRAQLQGTGISVTRQGDRIILNMPSNITFATDQDQINPGFYPTLNSVAIVLRKFDKTYIDINGHTDNVGNAAYNQGLSERRAASVANYLGPQGVDQRRISTLGFGMTQPIASNANEAGRAQNRRVEISIAPIQQ
jgi:outer membrane protein OmpA-like peptidoglycan-associated protein